MRIITNVFRACIFTLLYITVASCSGGCASTLNRISPVGHEFPVESFVQIRSETLWEGCQTDPETKEESCEKALMKAVSSGTFIRHSEIDSSLSYVLTAGHSCASTQKPDRAIGDVTVKHLAQRFLLVDYSGFKYEATVVAIDTRFDMCLLTAHSVFIKPPTVRLSKKRPRRGELVYNMAAPHGIVFPKMVLTFDGYFSGYSPEGYAMYSLPTKPGSSGSPIVNANNKLVGIIFAGYRSMENIGVASPLIALKVFLRNSIAQAEIAAWSRLNKRVDKTENTMMKNMHKKLNKYFHIRTKR